MWCDIIYITITVTQSCSIKKAIKILVRVTV